MYGIVRKGKEWLQSPSKGENAFSNPAGTATNNHLPFLSKRGTLNNILRIRENRDAFPAIIASKKNGPSAGNPDGGQREEKMGDLIKGDLIRHERFGIGRVEQTSGYGEGQKCTVYFARSDRST